MTVGIGAICENGKAVVVAADKMITFGNPMNLQTEPPALKKIFELTEKALLVFSGSTADGEEIIAGARPTIAANPRQPMKDVAEVVKQSYANHKQRRIEDNILRPMLGADFAKFQNLVAQSPTSQILQQVLGLIMQHNLNTDVLIAGLDDTGAHVFIVTHPGQLLPLATTGFGAVGSGAVHAAVRLSLSQHTGAASLIDTLYNVYEAKRSAEVAPGVGKLTDLALIYNGRICSAGPDLLKALDNSHKEKPTLSKHEHDALKKACDECIKPAEPAKPGVADGATGP